MEAAALCLLLLLDTLESAGVSPNVSPSRSQFFKYEPLSVRCEGEEQQEQDNWRVVKRTEDGEVRPCPSPCAVTAAFPATDTGVYWCETGLGETSNTVNITVTARPVILESPVLPVMEGLDVTLLCRVLSSSCNLTASFYKDGLFIGTSSTRNMTIHSVSASDEGLYKCNVCGVGDSSESWLTIRAPPAGPDPPPPSLSLTMVLRHLMVGTPYLLSTVLLGLIYRDRKRAQHISEHRQTSDDVVMQRVI